MTPQQPCCEKCLYSKEKIFNRHWCKDVDCPCHKGGEKAKCHCGKELEVTVKQQIEANAVGGECFECATSHGACSCPQFFTESYADSVKRKESTPFNNLQEAEWEKIFDENFTWAESCKDHWAIFRRQGEDPQLDSKFHNDWTVCRIPYIKAFIKEAVVQARITERKRVMEMIEEIKLGWKGDIGTASLVDGNVALTTLLTKLSN